MRSYYVLNNLIFVAKYSVWSWVWSILSSLEEISSLIYTTISCPLSVWSTINCVAKPLINHKLTCRENVINLTLWNHKNTDNFKRWILFLIKFILISAMIILFIFLTRNTFSLVIKPCSSDLEVAKTGNGRLSVDDSSLHSLHVYYYRKIV